MAPALRRARSEARAPRGTEVREPEDDLTPMVAGLSDPDPAVRRAMAKALGEGRDPRAVSALEASLGDPSPAVRASAAESLGAIGRSESYAPLDRTLEDPDPRVREQAARALRLIADPPSTHASARG
ncbi:MAG: HEAT repeat domain-containing protein, partial [Thermoplasmata archaeon]|nr:HEAT repeat domain-containing protein [Thermoplasmata archaeon]